MKKLLTRIVGATLGLALVIGVSVGVANNREAKEVNAAAGDISWRRVTSVDTLLAGGTFILGHEATANSGVIIPMANSGSATTSAAGFMYSGASASSGNSDTINMATVTVTSSYEVTIGESSEVDGAIYIKVGNNYLGNTNTKNNCKLFTTQSATTSFTPTKLTNDKMQLDIEANTSGSAYRYLKYNTGSPRFAVYASGQQNPVFYQKIVEQGITGFSEAYTDETVALSSNANVTVTWSIVAADTTAAGAAVTSAGVVSVTGPGTVKVKAVANGYTDVTHTITFSVRPAGTYYTVSFNSNGGSASPSNLIVAENATFTFPSPGTKEHHSFDGWTSTGSAPYYAADSTSPAVVDDITYTAHWTEDDKYTVTYTAGSNGSGSYADGNHYACEYTLLPFNSLDGIEAASGYRFKDYTVGGTPKNPGETFTLSANTSVTVNFEEIPTAYEITFGPTKNTNPGNGTALTTSTFLSVYSVDSKVSCTAISYTYGISSSRLKMGTKNNPASITLQIPLNQYITKVEAVISDGYDLNLQVKSGASDSTQESQNIADPDTYVFDDYLSSEKSNVVTISSSASGAFYLTELNLHYANKEVTNNGLATRSSLSYSYIKQGENDFDFSNVKVRFGGIILKTAWDELNTESTIQGYGVLLSTDSHLGAEELKNKIDSVDGTNVKNFYNTLDDDTPTLFNDATYNEVTGNYYVWNLRKALLETEGKVAAAALKETFASVAYIVTKDKVVFFNETRTSAKSLAASMVSGPSDPAYEGSLAYLANLA